MTTAMSPPPLAKSMGSPMKPEGAVANPSPHKKRWTPLSSSSAPFFPVSPHDSQTLTPAHGPQWQPGLSQSRYQQQQLPPFMNMSQAGLGVSQGPMRWADFPMDTTPLFSGNVGPYGFTPAWSQAGWHSGMTSSGISPVQQQHHYALGGPPPPVRAPTKVLFIRNLPPDIAESQLTALFERFGTILNCLLLPTKQAAFIEFDDLAHAQACFFHYQAAPCEIFGRPVEVLYSGRDKVVKRDLQEDKSPSSILLVTVSQIEFPVTVEVLKNVFGKHGSITKIIIFSRGSEEQAFVEFEEQDAAVEAKQALDGRNIYAGCNHLKITYSTMKSLTVKQKDTRNWAADGILIGNPEEQKTNADEEEGGAERNKTKEGKDDFEGPDKKTSDDVLKQKNEDTTLKKPPPSPLSGSAIKEASGLNNSGLLSSSSRMERQSATGQLASKSPLNESGVPVPVVLVKNLDEEASGAAELAALFAVYGDVIRVKIMFNKRNHALVQMGNIAQCQQAIANLQYVPLHGHRLALEMSKGGEIPPIGRGKTKLASDFDDANYARHKGRSLPMFPPCPAIHISNLPDKCTEEDVIKAIEPFGTPGHFKFLGDNHRMAIVTYPTLEAAVKALVSIHGHYFDGRQMRCAFARHPAAA